MNVDGDNDGSSSAGTSIPEDFNPSSGSSLPDGIENEDDPDEYGDEDASGVDDPDYA